MGISFVSKVAPPQYKGMMMGGWFGATAIGNLLVAVGGFLWGGIPLWGRLTVAHRPLSPLCGLYVLDDEENFRERHDRRIGTPCGTRDISENGRPSGCCFCCRRSSPFLVRVRATVWRAGRRQ